MLGQILQGHVLDILRSLPDESVQCVVTSPPYWGLRDYKIEAQDWGDWRGSLGLEPTPELFVKHIVEIFREVQRVLRSDGCIFVNLGDSYASGKGTCFNPGGGSSSLGQNRKMEGAHPLNKGNKSTLEDSGLKPKDLCGIPWRVARALQEPYYTGRIKNEADRIWLAAMIDGEGCMFIHKRKIGQSNGQGYERKSDSYGAGLEVANVHLSIIERCQKITGMGSICRVERESRNKHRNIPLYRWNMRSNQCREVVREIYPYLVGKQHEARLLLGCPSSGPDAEKAHASLIALHNAREATIDFPAPESLYEPGFYLRSDIVWSKLNPMPESVTDRPTKAHEYLFLLTKSAKYFFDQEAVREPTENRVVQKPAGWNQGNGRHDTINGRYEKDGTVAEISGRNLRSVWTIATQPFPEAHFATFPEAIPEKCIKAGSKIGDVVLDPFFGAGTVGLVAEKLNRKWIGIELNPEYCEMAKKRILKKAWNVEEKQENWIQESLLL